LRAVRDNVREHIQRVGISDDQNQSTYYTRVC
jgi:hypothetical protein